MFPARLGRVSERCSTCTIGTSWNLPHRTLLAAAIFLAALILLTVVRKLPEPVLILAAGVAGLALKAAGR